MERPLLTVTMSWFVLALYLILCAIMFFVVFSLLQIVSIIMPVAESFFDVVIRVVGVVFGLLGGYVCLVYAFTYIKITPQMVHFYSLGCKKSIPISHIQSVTTHTKLWQRLLGISDLSILTGGAGNATKFVNSRDSQRACKLLQDLMNIYQQ